MRIILVTAVLLIATAAAAKDCTLVSDGSVRVWQCAPTPTPEPAEEKK